VCFLADVVASSEPWDRVAVVRYPTRHSFIEMQSRPDFQAQHVHKEAGMDRTIIVATLPSDGLPSTPSGGLVRLDVWDGVPPPAPDGPAADFVAEGTIVSDGRPWSGVRYTTVDAAPDLSAATPGHQMLVLQPVIEQWA
jgi:hypothetical protein